MEISEVRGASTQRRKEKRRFTDPAFIPITALLLFVAVFFIVYTSGSKMRLSGLTGVFTSKPLPTGYRDCLVGISASLILIMGLYILLIFSPVPTIHALFLSLIGSGVFFFFYTMKLFKEKIGFFFLSELVPLMMLIGLYVMSIKYIPAVGVLLSQICRILLRNFFSFAIYPAVSVLGLFLLLSGLFTVVIGGGGGHYPSHPELLPSALFLALILFYFSLINNASDVYYGRMMYEHLMNKKEGRSPMLLPAALKQVMYSSGTIFFATLIYLVVQLSRMFTENAMRNQARKTNRGYAGIAILVLLFLLTVIMTLLDIAIATINKYALVHTAIHNQSYKDSIKNSFSSVKERSTLYNRIVILVPIVHCSFVNFLGTFCFFASEMEFIKLSPRISLQILTVILVTQIGLNSLFSSLLAIEYVTLDRPEILGGAYPYLMKRVAEKLPKNEVYY